MEIVIRNSESYTQMFSFEFDSKVPVNTGNLKSFDELVTLKDIEYEIRECLGITDYWTRIMPDMTRTTVSVNNENFIRIKTIVRRDTIIENILK